MLTKERWGREGREGREGDESEDWGVNFGVSSWGGSREKETGGFKVQMRDVGIGFQLIYIYIYLLF